jgi:hypothetical protein
MAQRHFYFGKKWRNILFVVRKKTEEKRLLEIFGGLPEEARGNLLAFAEFLASRHPVQESVAAAEPLDIPRPAEESVVKALQRLRETYPMLNPDKLLHESAGHMQRHLLQGCPAAEVINDLEAMFARHFQEFRNNP